MEVFADYLEGIDQSDHRNRLQEILEWVKEKFPTLEPAVKWNQPMFTDHGTFIIGFSVTKHHISVAPEHVTINHFSEDIVQAGYDYTKELVRIKWKHPVDYALLEKMIAFNIQDKADYTTFWRK
ncbi:iron chaperone [Virgibacillus xinjiangensis]|uniref:Iron chaperone n=1 Tax=Virgibacillus xinjiangensis TaxID=393090 RepID=A0ABV7CSV6_9BACI